MDKKPLIAIVGPTASGKTALSVELALKIDGCIVSADSMQVYRHMDIGTAKPTMEERKGVSHYLMDCIMPNTDFNVAIYSKMAHEAIEKILSEKKMPILVGGTGLYVDNIIQNIKLTEMKTDYILRNFLEKTAMQKGNEHLHSILSEVDMEAALRIHPNNVKRVIRALEVYYSTGKTITEQQENSKKGENPYDTIVFMPAWERDELYERIDRRVDMMFESGLVKEVSTLMEYGYTKDLNSMQGIGYKEVFEYLEGNITYDALVELIKKNSRNFAKRQMIWFKKNHSIIKLDPHADMLSQVGEKLYPWMEENGYKTV